MLYALLKTLSWLASHTPYKLLVKLGKGLGYILWLVLKKQRVRAENTIHERLGYSRKESKEVIKKMFTIRKFYGRPCSRKKAWSCWPATWTTGSGWEPPWP